MSDTGPQGPDQQTDGAEPTPLYDRAMAVGGPAMEGPPREDVTPGRAAPHTGASRPPMPLAGTAGAGLLAALAWLLWRLRVRRRPPTPSERLAEATKHLGTASAAAGGRAVGRLAEVAGPVVERTGELALQGAHRGADLSAEGAKWAATTAPVVVAGAGELAHRAADVSARAAHAGQRAGAGLVEVPAAVAGTAVEAADKVHRTWSKWTGRLVLTVAAALGYTLGARAGRERYEQIAGALRSLAGRPEVQRAQHRIHDKVTGGSSGGTQPDGPA